MTATVLHLDVIGLPAAQGSKRHVGGGRMVESSKALKPWREAVKAAAAAAMAETPAWPLRFAGPVRVTAIYRLPRPRHHYRTGARAYMLRELAPPWPAGKPDIEKLARGTHDALTDAGVWDDDSRVVALDVRKVYANEAEHVGAWLRIEGIEGAAVAARRAGELEHYGEVCP